MKKSQMLIEIIGDLPEQMILDAAPENWKMNKNKNKRLSKIKYLSIAAMFILIFTITWLGSGHLSRTNLRVYAAQGNPILSSEGEDIPSDGIELGEENSVITEYSPWMSTTPVLQFRVEYQQKEVQYKVSLKGCGSLMKYVIDEADEWSVSETGKDLVYNSDEAIYWNPMQWEEERVEIQITVCDGEKELESKYIEITQASDGISYQARLIDK